MSDEESTPEEWKTIRVSGSAYYRLAELSGILTALLGMKISMSTVADWSIIAWHDDIYPKARKLLLDPKKAEDFRKEVGGQVKHILELFRD